MTLRSWMAPLLLTVACGGPSPAPNTPTTPTPSATPSTSTSASAEAPPNASIVRFDDLGVSYTVPPGFHVVGDDDLAARIRASANPRLTADLQNRGSQKKGIPLLSLSKETSDPKDGLTITLTAAMVPKDATAAELLTQQQSVMASNLDGFTITDAPKEHAQDGVPGLELADKYALRGSKVSSVMRLHVRGGLAFMTVAVWPDTAPEGRSIEARNMLDGLKFYDAKP